MITDPDPLLAGGPAASDPAYAVVARGVGKAYYPSASPAAALLDALTGRPASAPPFWALHPLDLQVEKGEVLGLVGHNGAGKSTLLQILSGTLAPSTGTLQVNGRVAALLELGAGFNPEFTGRENLLLNGPLLGLGRQQLAERIGEIIDFSGIEPFIDQPVKTYSSGMFVRLAFSLATSVDPEILVIDEALSVGDAEFSRKSFDRIMALRDRGTTILFCSHSAYQIESLCSRALWLDHGRARLVGRPAEVTTAYLAALDAAAAQQRGAAEAAAPVVSSPGHARIRALRLSCDGVVSRDAHAVSGQSDLEVSIGFDSDPALPAPHAAVTLISSEDRILASSGTWIDNVQLQRNASGGGHAVIRFPTLPLLKGSYTLSAYLFCERGLHIYSAAEKFGQLTVEQRHLEQGVVSLPHRWAVSSLPLELPTPAPTEAGPPLSLPATWSDRWHTRWSRPQDLPAVRELFREAFAAPVSVRRWEWKYRQAPTWGTLVEREGLPVGFFGGMPRTLAHRGVPLQAVQIGDVMVRPEDRGALGRSGPLYRAAAAYFGNMHALHPGTAFAFGFPSRRHLELGLKLGLYEEADAIHQLSWPTLAATRQWRTKTRAVHDLTRPREARLLAQLWQAMQRDWPELVLPQRDAARWHYRYAEHPEHSYQLLLVSSRLGGGPIAAVALRQHADHVEWIDYLGGRAGVALALRAVRMRAHELGVPEVRGWFSTALLEIFGAQAQATPTEIGVPVNRLGRDGVPLPGRLWLMAGDSDFR